MAFGPTGFGNIGQAMTQPVATPTGTGTATDMSKWQMFRNRLANDPNLRMAMLTAGLNMFRTPEPGRSSFDVFSNAALTGVGTLDQLRQRQRTQGLEDEDRVFQRETTERQLGQGDRRLDQGDERNEILGEGVAQRDRQLEQQNNQFEANLQLARDKLEEMRRQFDETMSKGGVPSGTTGQERLIELGVEALVTASPELYPDNEVGRAKARIAVQGIGPVNDADSILRARTTIFAALMRDNEIATNPLTPQQVQAMADTIVDSWVQGPDAAPQTGGLEGTTVTDDDGLGNTVEWSFQATSDGNYRILKNGVMQMGVYSEESIRTTFGDRLGQ